MVPVYLAMLLCKLLAYGLDRSSNLLVVRDVGNHRMDELAQCLWGALDQCLAIGRLANAGKNLGWIGAR